MGQNEDGVVQGYLLLADISGYTKFLTDTELEHSHAIVGELTKLIRACLASTQFPSSAGASLVARCRGRDLNSYDAIPGES